MMLLGAVALGLPAEQLMPRADGANAAVIAAASGQDTSVTAGVATGVDAAHPSGVGNCISVSASVPDFWCGQQTSPPANLCKCGDDRIAAEAEAKAKAKATKASAVKTPADRGEAEVQRREAEGSVDVVPVVVPVDPGPLAIDMPDLARSKSRRVSN